MGDLQGTKREKPTKAGHFQYASNEKLGVVKGLERKQ